MLHQLNRERVYDAAQGALIVITAYDRMQLSGDMAAPFLQQSSFWWLTGIVEPGWKVIIDAYRREAILVRPERSDIDVIFNGEANDDEIRAVSGIEKIIPMKKFEGALRQLTGHHTIVQTIFSKHEVEDEFVANPAQNILQRQLQRIFPSVQDCYDAIVGLRAIKQPVELERMQHAIGLTVKAFKDVKLLLPTLKNEAEIAAEFTYQFHRKNAEHAYEPIVASGKNACTMHYVANSAKTQARHMVLMDIGARVGGYSADITRTYCVNPTKRQKALHAAVEKAQQQIIALIEPNLPIADYLSEVDRIMKQALISLGLLKNMDDTVTYRKYFPHAVSHGLGVDTHDSLGRPRYLQPGMVLTVEPGIYIPDEQIGVRLEDDILVTKTGRKNLSGELSTSL